jgi:rare lipoprotein A (peptidoglycan hydrolase)
MFVTIAFVRGCSGDKAHQFSGVAAFYDRHYTGRTANGAHYNPNLSPRIAHCRSAHACT